MKYVKLGLAGCLAILGVSQYFIYGFLDSMIFWLIYSLVYLAAAIYQRFHASSVGSQVVTLLYVAAPLVWLFFYAAGNGFSRLTEAFYLVLMAVLAGALVWEIVSLVLVIKEKSDNKKHRD